MVYVSFYPMLLLLQLLLLLLPGQKRSKKIKKGPRCCPQRPHKPATPTKIIQRIKIARHRGWENQRGGGHDTQSKQQPPCALPLSLDLESLDQQLKHQQRLQRYSQYLVLLFSCTIYDRHTTQSVTEHYSAKLNIQGWLRRYSRQGGLPVVSCRSPPSSLRKLPLAA